MTADEPNLAALYLQHRDAMHRVAASVLREVGRADDANEAVNDAMVSIMESPPGSVRNWEAFLVTAAKRKALDIVRSARVRHNGPEFNPDLHDQGDDVDVADDVAESIDRGRRAGLAWDSLSALDDRQRSIVWQSAALGRTRADVAKELGVTGPRVSQILAESLRILRNEILKKEGGSDE